MKMRELVRYDVPDSIVALWEQWESESLLPLQEMVVRRHNLFGDGRLLVQAPTSSGKTFIAEMAAVQTALRRRKVVYLVPLKALAEEKFLDFQRKYASYGIDVIISTRDHREYDAAFESGNFSIAVVVYEKLAQLLVRRPERLEQIELFLADELEILSEPERGPLIEVLLTHLVRSPARLLGLSAVMGGADRFAEWMGADLVRFEQRPVELRYGVLHDGQFRYRTYNDYGEGEETMLDGGGDSPWDTLQVNLRALAEMGESCLVFVKDRKTSRRGADMLAHGLDLAAADTTIGRLEELEPTRSRDNLIETLKTGVAFHNADLSMEERRIIEQGFRNGDIRVLVSTSTLAVGMNLPARNVFISAEKWCYDTRIGMPWKAPILRSEYENMSGRAGRYGAGYDFGRSILVATSPFDQETLWRRYIEGEREAITPQLDALPLEDHIVRLVSGRACLTEETLIDFLESTLTGQWCWRETRTLDEVAFHVRAAIHRAEEAGMLTCDNNGRVASTPIGQAVASKGITIETAKAMLHWIRHSADRRWIELDPLLAAAYTPDGQALRMSLTAHEYDEADYFGLLKALTLDEDIGADVPMNRLRNSPLMPFYDEIRAIKVALLLSEWIQGEPMMDLEDRWQVLGGQIVAATEQIAWILDATATLAAVHTHTRKMGTGKIGTVPTVAIAKGALQPIATSGSADGTVPTLRNARTEPGKPGTDTSRATRSLASVPGFSTFHERLALVAERLIFGAPDRLLPLAREIYPHLSRRELTTLDAHGLTTAETVLDASQDQLTKLVGRENAKALTHWARKHAKKVPIPLGISEKDAEAACLVVDDARPGEMQLDGITIRLQDKQYRLIRLLALQPGACVGYETIYQALWGDVIVEQGQIHFQKRKLLDAIKNACPDHKNLIRTVPKRGYCLELSQDQVAIAVHKSEPVACAAATG